MASNSKNLAELLNSDVTLTATDIANGAVTTDKLADGAVTAPKTSGVGKKRNYIINGHMDINQRALAINSTTALTGGGVWISDRFFSQVSGTSIAVNGIVSDDVPNNKFRRSTKFAVATAATANDHNTRISTRLEGYDARAMGIGTSGNKLTLSFYIKSSRAGVHGVTLSTGYRGGSVFNQAAITLQYTINAADTWERKTITFDSYNSGGSAVWLSGTNMGVEICFTIGQGAGVGNVTAYDTWQDFSTDYVYPKSTSAGELWGTSTSDTCFITGIQLEEGDTASEWQSPDFGDELRRCMRYFYDSRYQYHGDTVGYTTVSYTQAPINSWHSYNSLAANWEWQVAQHPVLMRQLPSLQIYDVNGNGPGKMSLKTSTGGAVSHNYTPYGSTSGVGTMAVHDYNNSHYGLSAHYVANAEL